MYELHVLKKEKFYNNKIHTKIIFIKKEKLESHQLVKYTYFVRMQVIWKEDKEF